MNTTSQATLSEMYLAAAKMCFDQGVSIDGNPGGSIHQWVVNHVRFRPGTEFFIVTGICSAMCDLEAQQEGYTNQFDRAGQKMREKFPVDPSKRNFRSF